MDASIRYMRVGPSHIAPFLRSDAHGRILASILLADAGDQPLSAVSEASGVPLTTVQREIALLAKAGVVVTRKLGPARLVTANERYPLIAPLRQIVAAAYGPTTVLQAAFAGLRGLERLILFGSWAARISGLPGAFPGDVDVLVVGQCSRLEAIERAMDASDRIGREVNATIVSAEWWDEGKDGFWQDIRSKPFIELEVHTT